MKKLLASLRYKLVFSVGVAMIALMTLVAVGVYWAIRHESDEIFKARLTTSAKVLEGLISEKINELPKGKSTYIEIQDADIAPVPSTKPSDRPYDQKVAFQVWSDMGVLLAKSASAPMEPLGKLEQGRHKTNINAEEWQVFALKSGKIWVMAAEHNDVLEESTVKLMYAVFTPFVVGSITLMLLVNFLLLKGLQPIKDIAQQISERDAQSAHPISGHWPTELQFVATAFNKMLVKVNAAIQREKLFLDSAAHEIRTPITAIQLHLQNALQSTNADDQHHSIELAHKGVKRASRLISQMMELSRINADDSSQPATSFLALDEVARSVAQSMAAPLERRGQTIAIEADNDVIIKASLTDIESVLYNLLDNASKYGLENSVIALRIAAKDANAILSITNAGPSIAESEKDTIFLPYYRNIEGNQPGIAGSGLGLAIVKRFVDRMGAVIAVHNASDLDGSTFEITFPGVG